MYVGSNFDRPTGRHPVDILSRSLQKFWGRLGRGVKCRNICVWTFRSERNRFSMVPAPEEATTWDNKARRNREVVSRSVTLSTCVDFQTNCSIKGFPNKMLIKGFPNKIVIKGFPNKIFIKAFPNKMIIMGFPNKMFHKGFTQFGKA